MKCFLASASVASVSGRHPLYRECVTLRVLTHRWLLKRLEGVALQHGVYLDVVVLTAVEEMALHGDRIFRARRRRAHAARVRSGLAIAVPKRRTRSFAA